MYHSLFRRGRKATLLAAVAAGAALAVGCLERPVVPTKPSTSNVFVEQIQNKTIDAIDLLFVIDNSVSMADKQAILQKAVPQMVTRLVTPDCVTRNVETNEVTDRTASMGSGEERTCPGGYTLEFKPVNDIHIGVITSSIGGHGLTTQASCGDPALPQKNDRAWLLPAARGLSQPEFLSWTGGDQAAVTALNASFAQLVGEAGEIGCGFEAPLEAFYRFLIDPSPPANVVLEGNRARPEGIDQTILTQRRAFLRPSSLVAVVVLTDENDCSAMDGGQYYPFSQFGYGLGGGSLRKATPICESNPNDICCQSCSEGEPNEGCGDQFASCSQGEVQLPVQLDRQNVRCFQNKRRFGFDLLYPTTRYVDGLRRPTVPDVQQRNMLVPNPLLAGADPANPQPRPSDLVFFAGIVGVPWQDISTPESLTNERLLDYLSADELLEKSVPAASGMVDRWALILGEPNKAANSRFCAENPTSTQCGVAPVAPLDPFMIESIDPRTGANPLTGIAITAAPAWNAINGHEYNNEVAVLDQPDTNPARDDLQYSCIFPLAPYDAVIPATNCDPTAEVKNIACDCLYEPDKNRPLCKEAGAAAANNVQRWGKAYPATRVLEVLRDFGENSIVASICPKVHTPDTDPSYGYNPAVAAIVERLAEKLGGQCLPRAVSVDDATGEVPCTVVEARASAFGALDCTQNNRKAPTDQIAKAVRGQLESSGLCYTADGNNDGAAQIRCEDYTLCELQQFTSDTFPAQRAACLGEGAAVDNVAGYCYVDPAQGLGSETLVASCPATQKRRLLFIGDETPANNSITFVACVGDAATTVTPTP